MSEQLKLYGDFDVIAKDADGEVIQRREIDDSGAFTIEDIKQNALMHGLDEIRIVPRGFETRRGDETEIRVEPESGAEQSEVPDA
jgi:hypothetical protein